MSWPAARLAPSAARPEPVGDGAPRASAPVERPPALQPVVQDAAPTSNPDAPVAVPAGVPEARELARRVRASTVLTPIVRRYWLAVLPHLAPADRARLDDILRRAAPPASTTQSGNTRSDKRQLSGSPDSTASASEA